MLNDYHHSALNIYPELQMPHNGTAYRWELMCSNTGQMMMDVWRPTTDGKYQLVNKTYVSCMANIKTVCYYSPPHLVHGGEYRIGACPSVCPSVCLSVCPSVDLSVRYHLFLRDGLVDFLDFWYQSHFWFRAYARCFKFQKKFKMAPWQPFFPKF